MYLHNKYTAIYYRIINRAIARNHIKQPHDGYQTHHIIPRCFGGSDELINLVVLTYKEHRVCHRLLINMTVDNFKYKMMYAYKLFNKQYDVSSAPNPRIYSTPETWVKMVNTRKSRGSYKTGKDNNFADPDIIELVRKRMTDSNPMTRPEQRLRMSFKNNNPLCKAIEIDNICFPSIGKAAEYFNTTPHLFKKNYVYRLCDV